MKTSETRREGLGKRNGRKWTQNQRLSRGGKGRRLVSAGDQLVKTEAGPSKRDCVSGNLPYTWKAIHIEIPPGKRPSETICSKGIPCYRVEKQERNQPQSTDLIVASVSSRKTEKEGENWKTTEIGKPREWGVNRHCDSGTQKKGRERNQCGRHSGSREEVY